jgi:hypothetical protein
MSAPKTRGEEFWEDPDDDRHGTTNGYSNLKCRCESCTEAWRVWHRRYMHEGDRLQRHAGRQMARRQRQGGCERQRDYRPRARLNDQDEWEMPND